MIVLQLLFGLCLSAIAAPKLIYGVSAPIASLNPYLLSGVESYTVTGFALEPLARIEPFSQTLRPWLAREWKVDRARRTVRVLLREGVKFHNGDELTAEDVRFTWKSYADPAFKGEVWRAMWSEVEDVRVVAPFKFEIVFKSLRYQVFQNVMTALRILPRGVYQTVKHEQWTSQIVGSGPFQLVRFDPGRVVELQPFADWWGWRELRLEPGPVLMVKAVSDARLAEQMWRKKDLDVYAWPASEALPHGVRAFPSAFGRGFSLGLNFRVKALQDLRVRRALLSLWNRGALNDKIYAGHLTPALDSFAPQTKYYPAGAAVKFDVQAARSLLTEAGYGAHRKLVLRVLTNSAESERWVGLFQTDAVRVGVEIRVEKVADEAQWWQLVQQGKYELVAYDGAFSERPHSSVWHSAGAYNSSGFDDKELDRWLDQLEQEFDSSKRNKLIAKAIVHLRSQVAELPGLYTDQAHFLLGEGVTVDARAPLEPWRWRKKP